MDGKKDREPMAGRILRFTVEQLAKIRAIEEACNAEVIVLAPFPEAGEAQYAGFLSRPREYRGEAEREEPYGRFFKPYIPYPEENGELCYILDRPTAGMMPEEERRRYPELIRREIPSIKTYSAIDSCNILPSRRYGGDVDRVLCELEVFTGLLQMGWHLGREEEFTDPFIPEPEPKSEEELLWEEYLDERRADES